MQDPSSNAMTEVALGLSMAFFALLVVALVSIGLNPTNTSAEQGLQPSSNELISQNFQVDHLQVSHHQADTSAGQVNNNHQQLFFYVNDTLYTSDLVEIPVAQLSTSTHPVLAISATMNVKDLVELKQQLNGINAEFTMMNNEWHAYFSSFSSQGQSK